MQVATCVRPLKLDPRLLVAWMRFRLSTPTCIGFAAGLVLGACLGRLEAFGIGDAQAAPGPHPDLELPRTASWISGMRLAAHMNALETPVEMSTSDVSQTVERSISQMSDRDLESVLASTIHLDGEEIADVRDIRAFAQRLADIAMEDTLLPSNSVAGGERVIFTTSPALDEARHQFSEGEARIYAVFPTEYFDREKVMVKWYRRDRPEILLLRRYPITVGDPEGHVWLAPEGGWEQGHYRVDIYSGDESMALVASGNYSVQ